MENYFNIHTCEQCDTVIYLDKYRQIFECPVCGLLSITDDNRLIGTLSLKSPEVLCDQDPNHENIVLLNSIDSETDEAIRVLLEKGWRLKFSTDT